MRCLSRRGLLPSERANLWRLPVAIRRLLFLRYDRPRLRQLPNVRLSFLINRSRSAEPSELASALAYSRFSPPIDIPPPYDLFQFHVLRFYGKVRGTYGEGCTFVRVSARLCTFPHISAHFCTSPCYPSSKKPDSRRTRYSPCLSFLHTFPEMPFIFQDT